MEPPYREPTAESGLWHSLRGSLNRNVLLLVVGGSLFNVPIGFIFVALPIYLGRLPTIPSELIGLPFTTMGLVAVAVMIPFGMVADRFGRRRMLFLGGLAGIAGFILFSFVDTLEGILLVAAVLGLAEGFYFSTWNALLADASTPETRNTVFGISFFAAGIALAAGSLVGWFADQAIQAGASPQEAYQPLLLLLGFLVIPTPLMVLSLRLKRAPPSGPRTWLPRRSMGIIIKFLVANLLIGFGAGTLIPLLSEWFRLQFGVGETFTGPLYALSSIVNAFAFLLAPALARRVGAIRSIVVAQAVATAILFSMPFSRLLGEYGLASAAVLFVARNALMNMAWPVMSAFLMGAVHPDERSTASAVTGAFFRAPQASSTTLGGYLLDVDLALPFYVTTFFYVLGTGAFWYFFRRQREVSAGAAEAGAEEAAQPK